jgi:hypothetical protein
VGGGGLTSSSGTAPALARLKKMTAHTPHFLKRLSELNADAVFFIEFPLPRAKWRIPPSPTETTVTALQGAVATIGPTVKIRKKVRFIRGMIGSGSQMKQLSGGGYSSK